MADEALVLAVIREVGRRARDEPLGGLNHPLVVDAELGRHLGAATDHADLSVGGRRGAVVERLLGEVLASQRNVNAAVVAALHQLDHRTRTLGEDVRHVAADAARATAIVEDHLGSHRGGRPDDQRDTPT